jgi:hypothetical protein
VIDQRDVKALVKAGIILASSSAVVLTIAGVFGLAIRIFNMLAWGGS